MGGGDGWGEGPRGGVKMETTVLEQQLKKKKRKCANMLKYLQCKSLSESNGTSNETQLVENKYFVPLIIAFS